MFPALALSALVAWSLTTSAMGVPLAQQPPPARAMALTFDDLLFVSRNGAYLPGATRATNAILDALERHKAPAIGFVNEQQLDVGRERAQRVALLRAWKDAGMSLGNHTYSHVDFNRVTVEQFKQEIVRGEKTLDELQPARPGERRFFRHPMTHTGNTADKKEAITRFLLERGYTIAPHTIENNDFIFDVVESNATKARDTSLTNRVRAAYLDYTMEATAFAERIGPQIFGHEIPQVLLVHANDLNASTLDEMLRRFEARGYRFVTLASAMTDPAYATKETVVTDYGPTWFVRWSKSLGLTVSFAGDPDPPKWVMDLYGR